VNYLFLPVKDWQNGFHCKTAAMLNWLHSVHCKCCSCENYVYGLCWCDKTVIITQLREVCRC
jgi:hypothetical protein